MSSEPFSPDSVVVATFEDDANAYQALTDLKTLDTQGQLSIAGAAVVTREPDGRIDVQSEVGKEPYVGMASGGMIGLLLGIIGGPLGMLLGGTTGLLIGSFFDYDEVETTESVLGEISAAIQPGRTALLAQVVEQSPTVVDTAMGRLGGTVLRRSAIDVEDEIAAAEEAERKAKHEARKELHQARLAENRAHAHAKVEELKAKLHRPTAGAPA